MQFLLEFSQGRREPRSAYMVCGEIPARYCVGIYKIAVNPDRTVSYTPSAFERVTIRAPYDFTQLSFFDIQDQLKLLAHADTRLVKQGETIQLELLSSLITPGYEEILKKVVSA